MNIYQKHKDEILFQSENTIICFNISYDSNKNATKILDLVQKIFQV